MILEIAQIEVKPGMEAEFEANVKKAVPIFQRSNGCKAMSLRRSHETPQLYMLFVTWDAIENHTKEFFGSDNWKEWRGLVGHCFAKPPNVGHVNEVLKGF